MGQALILVDRSCTDSCRESHESDATNNAPNPLQSRYKEARGGTQHFHLQKLNQILIIYKRNAKIAARSKTRRTSSSVMLANSDITNTV